MTLPPSRTLFWPVVVALLSYLFFVQLRAAITESITADEPIELAAGYSYFTTGDFRMNTGHPPLAKMIAALPLLRFGVAPPRDPTPWQRGDQLEFAKQWFAANERKADSILLVARVMMILLSSCLGLAVALWTRAAFGPAAALLALALYAFDPAVAAHGHYVKNDLPLALFAFLACVAFSAYVERPTAQRLLLASIPLGLAIATKLSAFFLLPVFALLYAIWCWQRRDTLWRAALSLTAMVFLAFIVVWTVYEIPALPHHVDLGGVNSAIIRAIFDRNKLHASARLLAAPIPAHPFLQGLSLFLDLNGLGHASYLFGKVRNQGWWYYFPVAFAAKMPVATLAFVALALAAAIRRLRRVVFRRLSFDWFVLAAPIAIYAASTLLSPIGVGIRHLLPVWPFLFIFCAAAFMRTPWPRAGILLAVLCTVLAAENVSIYPHYLAFFNILCGGPAHGPAILADSNIDWGQDAKNLAKWLQHHPAPPYCIDYWGAANLSQLGLNSPSTIGRLRAEGGLPRDCTAAVSVNYLAGGITPEIGPFGWLRACHPEARIGYSIYVYDLRRCVPKAEARFAAATHPAFVSVTHQDFRGAPAPADPAVPGEVLAFGMTGLGPVSPPVPPGRPTPLDVLSRIDIPLLCQWDPAARGPLADILFAGLAPGQTGVYQVNLLVPPKIAGNLACRSAITNSPPAVESIAISP